MGDEFEEVKQDIKKVEEQIAAVERELKNAPETDVAYLRKKEEQLREEKKQLREEKKQLRKKEEQLREEKILLLEGDMSEGESSRKRKRLKLSHMELTQKSGAASTSPLAQHATVLGGKIVAAVGNMRMPSSAFADPTTYVNLPFPALNAKLAPERFRLDKQGQFSYMGREKYSEVRDVVLSLWAKYPNPTTDLPPVHPDKDMRLMAEGSLWGNMGNGKSYILAALVCELMSSFRELSVKAVDDQKVQMQRVVFLPNCSRLLVEKERLVYLKSALMLGYADDGITLAQIDGLRDEAAVYDFVKNEHMKGIFLYFIVDQENALDSVKVGEQQKSGARGALTSLALYGGILKGASANNENAKKWHRKQTDIKRVFLYGGLSEEEYGQWKKHVVGTNEKAVLGKLSEGEEQRIKYETGCLPIFLQCWSANISPEEAWKCFFELPEISYAQVQLTRYMDKQVNGSNASSRCLRAMYSGFVSGGKVMEAADEYDCRYLYTREGGNSYRVGECVCGVVKRILAEHLQKLDKDLFLQVEWRESILREAKKERSNLVILGFMVEQTIIAKALSGGINLFDDKPERMDRAVYFDSRSEGLLELQEGWTLYVPSAHNYPRVDAVARGWFPQERPGEQLHVTALQITMSNVQIHLISEEIFWNPKVCDVWFGSVASGDVSKYFVWYIRRAELDRLGFDTFSKVEENVFKKKVVQRAHNCTFQVVENLVCFK